MSNTELSQQAKEKVIEANWDLVKQQGLEVLRERNRKQVKDSVGKVVKWKKKRIRWHWHGGKGPKSGHDPWTHEPIIMPHVCRGRVEVAELRVPGLGNFFIFRQHNHEIQSGTFKNPWQGEGEDLSSQVFYGKVLYDWSQRPQPLDGDNREISDFKRDTYSTTPCHACPGVSLTSLDLTIPVNDLIPALNNGLSQIMGEVAIEIEEQVMFLKRSHKSLILKPLENGDGFNINHPFLDEK